MAQQERPSPEKPEKVIPPPALETPECSLQAIPKSFRRQSPREIEVRYFVPDALTESLTARKEYIVIEQHYFPQKTVRDLVQQFGVSRVVADYDDFSTARIRRTKYSEDVTIFELEFKGPKVLAAGAPISRSEFGIAISKELFEELSGDATAGSLKKRRYNINGKIEDGSAWKSATGHLDIVRRAGPSLEKVRPCFATIDIELSTARLLPALRAGRHSFRFLRECVEINRMDSDIRSSIANSSIARNGLQDEQKEALKELSQEAKRLSTLNRKLHGQ